MSILSNIRNKFYGYESHGSLNNSAFNEQAYANILNNFNYKNNLPSWVSLRTPEYFESAVRYNPIVNSAIRLLATTASNGRKYIADSTTGEEIPWTEKDEVVQKIKSLLIDKPNPTQSGKEYDYQGVYYLETFGNRMVYGLMPAGFDKELDILNIEALWNLPSQFMNVRTTGKLYNQSELNKIITSYANTETNPVTIYDPKTILHYNDVNISSEQASLMGISKLEALRDPIMNIEACFQAMNTLLRTGGAKGIISVDTKDGQGSIVPLMPGQKDEIHETFGEKYGIQDGQSPFLISPLPLQYNKIAMSAKELGIYEELSNNTLYVGNMLGIPPDLLKTDSKGSTYENQRQSTKRLYQDTTIPKVEDRDQYTSQRLNLEKYGMVLKTKWDHIPVLADDAREAATANNLNVKAALSEYEKNLITWNQYLNSTGREEVNGGNVYFYEREKKTNPTPTINTNE